MTDFRQTYDPEKFNLDVARLKRGGHVFEVVIDADKAISYKEGVLKDISEVFKYEKVFVNAQKGQLAPEGLFKDIFNTDNIFEICRIIVDEGKIHITAEKRKREIERKKKKIISLLQRNGVDPRTDLPHPISRIESAIEESKVSFDEFKPVEVQAKEILKKIQAILPIKFEKKEIEVHIMPKYAHNVYRYMKNTSTVTRVNWGPDQSLSAVVEIPGGLEEEFYDNLNSMSHGTVETRLISKR